MKSTKVQTLSAIPGLPSEHTLMKRVFEKAHTLIKNAGVTEVYKTLAGKKRRLSRVAGRIQQIMSLLVEKRLSPWCAFSRNTLY